MSAEQATKIAHILGNSASALRTGPITQDTTPANLQLVDPDTRRTQMPGFDVRSDDPYYAPNALPETEERVAAERQSDVQSGQSVVTKQQASRDIKDGAYVQIKPEGDSVSASLRVVGSGQHAYLDPQANQIVAKEYRAEVGNEDQFRIRHTVEEQDGATVWKTQLMNLVYLPVMTTVQGADGQLTTAVQYVWVWVDQAAGYGANPLQSTGTMRVITDVYWNGTELVKQYEDIPTPPGWYGGGGGYGSVAGTGDMTGKGNKYACNSSGCAVDANGVYATLAECKAGCAGEQATDYGCGSVTCPASLTSATGQLPAPMSGGSISEVSVTISQTAAGEITRRYFSTLSAAGTITLTYRAGCFPARFQLWAPQCGQNGGLLAERVMKRDTGYRASPANDCGDALGNANPPCTEQSQGSGAGTVTWSKPAGVTCVEVAVIVSCYTQKWAAADPWEYTILHTPSNPAP
jgi:hypothetical protein